MHKETSKCWDCNNKICEDCEVWVQQKRKGELYGQLGMCKECAEKYKKIGYKEWELQK